MRNCVRERSVWRMESLSVRFVFAFDFAFVFEFVFVSISYEDEDEHEAAISSINSIYPPHRQNPKERNKYMSAQK